jgi:4-alpha-glucanotransferase
MTAFPSRASGVLLHPTSLPGPHGIGDLGRPARDWIDFLAETGTALWQILPLGPTGYGDSPYQCFSAFAGNPYLVSPDLLVVDGLLTPRNLSDRPRFSPGTVDYGAVIPWKVGVLDRAYRRFRSGGLPDLEAAFASFREENAMWVEDFGIFMALKDLNDLRPWWTWEEEYRFADPGPIRAFVAAERERVDRHVFRQFLFARQWGDLRSYAASRNVTIVGDIPIFVAPDSADVWANPHLFTVNDDRTGMDVVAGVPPDYFSETGQLWGNPLYHWERHAETGYAWWLSRLEATLATVDVVRIDHFRAFADYWEIPADAETAEHGRWLDGPGMGFFDTITEVLGELPIIAEDLGDLSPAVPRLLRQTGLPGMKILQFAFDTDERDDFLPHTYELRCVAYTGTHDNETGLGWWEARAENGRDWVLRYLDTDGSDISGALIEAVWQSRAMFAITPLQTLLRLGSEARMNTPGTAAGNWQWRYEEGALTHQVRAELQHLNLRFGRIA